MKSTILTILTRAGHGLTFSNLEWEIALGQFTKVDTLKFISILLEMESIDHSIILHRDSTFDKRHSDNPEGITLVCLRPKAYIAMYCTKHCRPEWDEHSEECIKGIAPCT